MSSAVFRVESAYPIIGPLLPGSVSTKFLLLVDCALAVVVAAKSFTLPFGKEIRVVHIPSGEIIYRKTAEQPGGFDEDF